jgi:predicted nucleic-acid-binding protein
VARVSPPSWAKQVIEQRLTEENPGFISIVAIVEMVWILGRTYSFADHEIVAAIERTLQADVLVVENEQAVFTAMIALKEGRGEFADALIAAVAADAGCSETLTFDRKAARPAGSRLL